MEEVFEFHHLRIEIKAIETFDQKFEFSNSFDERETLHDILLKENDHSKKIEKTIRISLCPYKR